MKLSGDKPKEKPFRCRELLYKEAMRTTGREWETTINTVTEKKILAQSLDREWEATINTGKKPVSEKKILVQSLTREWEATINTGEKPVTEKKILAQSLTKKKSVSANRPDPGKKPVTEENTSSVTNQGKIRAC